MKDALDINQSNFEPDLPHSNSNLSNSHSHSRSIQGILLLQTNTLALLLHLRPLRLLWLSSPPLALHFKLHCFSENMPIIPPQHMPVPSHSIRLCPEPPSPSIPTIRASVLFFSISFAPHIALTIALSPSQNCHFIFPQTPCLTPI